MDKESLYQSLEDLINSVAVAENPSVDIFSLVLSFLFLTEITENEERKQSPEFIDLMRSWFNKLRSENVSSSNANLKSPTSQDKIIKKMKYHFVGACWSPLMVLYPDFTSSLNESFAATIKNLVKLITTGTESEGHRIVPILFSLYQGIPELEYDTNFSNYLSTPEVMLFYVVQKQSE